MLWVLISATCLQQGQLRNGCLRKLFPSELMIGSGVFAVLGTVPPVLGAKKFTELLTKGAQDVLGAAFAVETDPLKTAELIIEHITAKRKGWGWKPDQGRFQI